MEKDERKEEENKIINKNDDEKMGEEIGEEDEEYYKNKGFLMHGSVWVVDIGTMKKIYRNGSFGKGAQSRGAPFHYNKKFRTTDAAKNSMFQKHRKSTGLHYARIPLVKNIPKGSSVIPENDEEWLQLSLEEAFYLAYVLNILEIIQTKDNGEEKTINCKEAYKLFKLYQLDFDFRWSLFYYYTRKKWIVKIGMAFGGIYALYKDDPSRCHAEYILHGYDDLNEKENQGERWELIQSRIRMCSAAGKKSLFCSIKKPEINGDESLEELIVKLMEIPKVSELLVNPWRPNSQREIDLYKMKKKNQS